MRNDQHIDELRAALQYALKSLQDLVHIDNGTCSACHGHWFGDLRGGRDFFAGEHRPECPIHNIRRAMNALARSG